MVHSITNFIYHHYGIKRKIKDDFILRYDENGNAIFNKEYNEKYSWYFEGKVKQIYIISYHKQNQMFGELEKNYLQDNRKRMAKDLLICEYLNSLKIYWKVVEDNDNVQQILPDVQINQQEEKENDNDVEIVMHDL